MDKKDQISKKERKMIKTVSGATFNYGHPCSGWAGVPPVPRWFADLREQGKIRVNILDEATLYLRDDGRLFSISKQPGCLTPLENANIKDVDEFLENIANAEKASRNWEVWEACEYLPDIKCPDRTNIWRVAAGARRSGRFLYTTKRKIAKQYLEGLEEDAPWIYSEKFDQYTEEYEIRYQKRVKERAKEMEESRRNAKRIHINADDFNLHIPTKPVIDHHAILGVTKKADLREIKRAYWALARQFHPDLNPNDSIAEEKFKSISVAYQELTNSFDV